jgi:DNA-binding CsgD family transcriptional regulator
MRQGNPLAKDNLERSWSVMGPSQELVHMLDDAASQTEYMWLAEEVDADRVANFRGLLDEATQLSVMLESGPLGYWLWRLDELDHAPDGTPEPYRLVIEGEPIAAARLWQKLGYPYENAMALSHGDTEAQLEALEIVNQLGATAVADKLWRDLRDQGVSIAPPRRVGGSRGGLTPRQVEVLSLLAKRLSNIEIADRLFLSPRTVENHVAAVMIKLGAHTRHEAVVIATEQGLLAVG